mgnify:CR=1 FL=1
MAERNKPAASSNELDDLVASSDTGSRKLAGTPNRIMLGTAAAWSLFQLWIASPLPFMVGFGVFSATESRSIHLAFAMFLAYMAYPAFKRSPRDRVPAIDWVLALVAAATAAYLYVFYEQLAQRPGAPILQDVIVAVTGIVLLLEATRRALGPPLMIVAIVFLVYSLAGPYMPAMLAHQGVSLEGLANHQWITTQGVFGIALGVSTSFVFLFVLFGALLDKAGAGNYFIKLAFSMLGHYRGGPAKAAVVASGMTGLISGSSIANVVTTGTFTVPMMKRVGFSAEKAGAVEVASSVNGQIMPPVMGAAAFLMVEYVGISYVEVIKHAFLPALISYIALIYIVHLEALKAGMQGLKSNNPVKPLLSKVIGFSTGLIGLMALSFVVYYGLGWLKPVLGEAAPWVVAVVLMVVYVALLKVSARYPELEEDDPNEAIVLPQTRPTLMVGLHYILPVIVLVWCLMVERLSPGLSAFWATVLMIIIIVTQRPLIAIFRGRSDMAADIRAGFQDLWEGLVNGARNMIGIGILALLENPEQAALLRDSNDPKFIANAVEELMRYLSIIQNGQRRVAIEDIEIGGETIRAGEGIILDLAPANWDAHAFPHPDKLDLTRDAAQQLGFGYGRHQCVGQQLARAELQIVFHTLLRRMPTMKLAIPFGEVPFKHDRLAYGVYELPVAW